VNVTYDVRAGDGEDVVVALETLRRLQKLGSSEILFAQATALDHRPHGTVQNEDARLQGGLELVELLTPYGLI
jgi:hypothetical protein